MYKGKNTVWSKILFANSEGDEGLWDVMGLVGEGKVTCVFIAVGRMSLRAE